MAYLELQRWAAATAAGLLLLAGCGSEEELPLPTAALTKLANPAAPAPDTSNKYVGNEAAIALGKKFYFDPGFSGKATLVDMLSRPMTTAGRAAAGQPINASCNTCHDVTASGSDITMAPLGHAVSFGAGAYDVNGQQTVNAGYLDLVYWNGRVDTLWAQIVAVAESPVSMNGTRLRAAWRIADAYRAEYTAVFGAEYPLPAELDSVAAQQARLEADGQCKLEAAACPASCRSVTSGADTLCLPRFPLEGKPGSTTTCEWNGAGQPFHDAFDCMDAADQATINRIYINFAKAIAAYEFTLLSKNAPFDRWVTSGFKSSDLSASAQRGARLFVGKGICAECHSGSLLTDNDFHNIGVPQSGMYVPTEAECAAGAPCDCTVADPANCLPWGFRDGARKLKNSKFRRDSKWSDDAECVANVDMHGDAAYAAAHPTECGGRIKHYVVTLTDALKGTWKTPSLRDVALTAPYMHSGQLATLREVVEHYNRGGVHSAGAAPGMKDARIVPLNLTPQEIDDLVAFMESLTGSVDAAVVAQPTVPPASPF
ncbi:MAG: hypothetical protein IT370_27915 [Deltaproteobacteria bacterium]|nr:hypothetical protein [Deltaproteobacteria bacterium]